MSDVRVGEVWEDKDRRMAIRIVKIVRVDCEHVWYHDTRRRPQRSRLARFVKAFRPVLVRLESTAFDHAYVNEPNR